MFFSRHSLVPSSARIASNQLSESSSLYLLSSAVENLICSFLALLSEDLASWLEAPRSPDKLLSPSFSLKSVFRVTNTIAPRIMEHHIFIFLGPWHKAFSQAK